MDLFELNARAKKLNPLKVIDSAIMEHKTQIIEDYQRLQLMKGLTPYSRYLSLATSVRNKKKEVIAISYRELKVNLNPEAGGNWDLNFTGKLYRDMYMKSKNGFYTVEVKGNVKKLENLTKIALRKFGDDRFLAFSDEQIEYSIRVYIMPTLLENINKILFL